MRMLSPAEDGHADVLKFVGEIDFHHSPVFRSVLQARIQERTPVLILDFSEIRYIDSTGLAALIGYGRDCEDFEGRFAIVGLSDRLREVFSMLRLENHLPLFSTPAEARAAFRESVPVRWSEESFAGRNSFN